MAMKGQVCGCVSDAAERLAVQAQHLAYDFVQRRHRALELTKPRDMKWFRNSWKVAIQETQLSEYEVDRFDNGGLYWSFRECVTVLTQVMTDRMNG